MDFQDYLDGSIVPLISRTSYASLMVGLKGVIGSGGAHPLRSLLGYYSYNYE